MKPLYVSRACCAKYFVGVYPDNLYYILLHIYFRMLLSRASAGVEDYGILGGILD